MRFKERFSHSLSWEGKLAGFGNAFQDHQDHLQSDLALHTSITIHAVDTKMDMLLFMRELEDPRERKARQFVEANGGVDAVSQRADLMAALQDIIGESQTITAADLRRELSGSVDQIIKANEDVFSRKFDAQALVITTEVQAALKREGDRVIKAIRGRPAYERLADWVGNL